MKLGIDGRGAIWYRGTGIGTYTWRLLGGLEGEKDCTILLPGMEYEGLEFGRAGVYEVGEKAQVWEKDFLPKALKTQGIDLYHVPQNGLGLPSSKVCKETVTIHDMIPYMFPETVGRGYLKEFLSKMPKVMAESDGIITVSESSKRDIMAIFDYPEDKIKVISEAPEEIYQPIEKKTARDFLAEQYHIKADYILYVGGFGIRKNVKALLLAYYLLRKEENISWHLVLPGKHTAEFERLYAMTEALNLTPYVHFCGYIPVAELPNFYAAAGVMAYPSFYEGFGLPPLEAMAAGCPVVAANTSSLPEVLGDAAMYFNPLDPVKMAELLYDLYQHPEKAAALSAKSLSHVEKFSWEKTIGETKAFFHKIAEK